MSRLGNDWTDRLFVERPGAVRIICAGCTRSMWVPPSKVDQRSHCSLECRRSTHVVERRGWDQRLHEPREGAVEQACVCCASPFWVPQSKTGMRATCSTRCVAVLAERNRVALQRHCETCGVAFVSRATSRSKRTRFCSQACNTAGRAALQSPEVRERALLGYRAARAAGRVRTLVGEENPNWKGGKRAQLDRRRDSGKAAAGIRAYRKANPDKVREFAQRRSGRKVDRLPYGSVPKIRAAQRNRCAVCRASLKGGSHLDHIQPLARGGRHVPANLQLLCAACNLTKSSRDPIEFMQSLGRLL